MDELGVNLHPTILGRGVPHFLPGDQPIDLELLRSRRLRSGSAYLLYRVARTG